MFVVVKTLKLHRKWSINLVPNIFKHESAILKPSSAWFFMQLSYISARRWNVWDSTTTNNRKETALILYTEKKSCTEKSCLLKIKYLVKHAQRTYKIKTSSNRCILSTNMWYSTDSHNLELPFASQFLKSLGWTFLTPLPNLLKQFESRSNLTELQIWHAWALLSRLGPKSNARVLTDLIAQNELKENYLLVSISSYLRVLCISLSRNLTDY